MRDLILKMAMSVDGFVSDLEGKNTWMFGADDEARAWNLETLWNADLHVMGSRSFQAMAAWWPGSTDMFAPPMNAIPKAVFSSQGAAILDGARESWAQAHVAGGDLTQEVARLKAQDGKPILAHGGVAFARGLVAAGLVDQFVLVVAPVALGQGLSLFSEIAAPQRLKLVTSRAFPGGAVAQTYRPT